MKKMTALVLALLLIVGLAGCGSTMASETYSGAAMGTTTVYVSEIAEVADTDGDAGAGLTDTSVNRSLDLTDVKMIYTGDLTLQTTELSEATSMISQLVTDLGGYIEEQTLNQNTGWANASFTVRIPAESFETFMSEAGASDLCTVTYQSWSADDVTEEYTDIEGRLETLQIKLERLQELLSQAENMEDIITIEDSISDVEHDIDYYSGAKNRYDSLIDYSTVYVNIQQVTVSGTGVDATYGQRLKNGFVKGVRNFAQGCGNFLLWVVSHVLGIIIFLIILAAVILLLRWWWRKRKAQGKAWRLRHHRRHPRPDDPAPPEDTDDGADQ